MWKSSSFSFMPFLFFLATLTIFQVRGDQPELIWLKKHGVFMVYMLRFGFYNVIISEVKVKYLYPESLKETLKVVGGTRVLLQIIKL